MNIFGGIVVYVGSWATLIAGIWTLFDKISNVTSPDFNAKVTLWIQNINFNTGNIHTNQVLFGFFTRFFGEKQFSLKSVYRSALYTIFTFLLCVLNYYFQSIIWNRHEEKVDFYSGSIYFFYMLFQDYFALFKTRAILKLSKKSRNIFFIIALDLFSTIIILLISIFFMSLFVTYLDDRPLTNVKFSYIEQDFWLNYIIFIKGGILTFDRSFLFFYTIFLGTLWVIFIQLTGLFTKIFSQIFKYFNLFKSIIDIQQQPIKSLGAISILGITFMYALGLPIYLLIHK
ncbi:hypothetical protein SAMN05216490_4596 [Mucilaginibacter mallensis]|uniref:Uncharacterized protein n=1 Tax=Mucilaginibacter mallensis TaxID=652787 RepID=A0A1H2C4U1_MUCMA|nr:hypothetical protein [Mucilaginibacter mallensis]SDT65026.1 hypothetical protein SAMN05216490_4596 [Mucilaginibacter mallensis]